MAFKIFRKNCCGLDVHKTWIYACIGITDINGRTPFIDKRCKYPIEEIQAAVDGAISREQAAKLKECLQHIDELNAHKLNIEQEILRLAKPYSTLLSLIQTAPGLSGDPMTAMGHADISTTMDVYNEATAEAKLQSHNSKGRGIAPRPFLLVLS